MKVKIQRSVSDGCLDILFYEGKGENFYAAQPCEFIVKKVNQGGEIKPTLKIHGQYAQEFLQSLAEMLDEEGVKTKKDAKIQGTLEATRFHLEDLRKMLKLR